jgi:hypothetical protein
MLKNILKHILLLAVFAGIGGAAQLQSERYFDNTGGSLIVTALSSSQAKVPRLFKTSSLTPVGSF